MKKGKDISAKFGGLYLVHQNIPGKKASSIEYDQHIIFIPLQGEISVQTEVKNFKFGMGQMLYLPPKTHHSFSSSEKFGERLIAMVDQKLVKHSELPISPILIPLNQLGKEILFYLLLHPRTPHAKSLVKVFCETLGETLVDSSSKAVQLEHLEGKTTDSRVRNALEFMRDNIADSPTMETIAKRAGLSARNFNRIVLKETGIQPKQWLINFRIEKAKELLRVPGASVTDVAFSVGYNSLGQFISAFRSRTGQLPSEYLRHG